MCHEAGRRASEPFESEHDANVNVRILLVMASAPEQIIGVHTGTIARLLQRALKGLKPCVSVSLYRYSPRGRGSQPDNVGRIWHYTARDSDQVAQNAIVLITLYEQQSRAQI